MNLIVRLILATVVLLSLHVSCSDSPHPSDAALEKIFREHETEFESLLSVSKIDSKVMRIAPDFTWLVDDASWPRPKEKLGFSEDRWNQYRQLFQKLELMNGLLSYQDEKITYFLASTKGLVTGGSGKGYVYSEKGLEPLADSLDKVSPELLNKSANRTVYKRIKPNWYLFYDSR